MEDVIYALCVRLGQGVAVGQYCSLGVYFSVKSNFCIHVTLSHLLFSNFLCFADLSILFCSPSQALKFSGLNFGWILTSSKMATTRNGAVRSPSTPTLPQSRQGMQPPAPPALSGNKPDDYVYFARSTSNFSDEVLPRAKGAQMKLEHYYKVAVDSAIERNTR